VRRLMLATFTIVMILVPSRLAATNALGPQTEPIVRYHFGDSPQWADPKLDDSSWPIAPQGLVPSRANSPDRFLWMRMHIPAPTAYQPSASPSVALRLSGLGSRPMTWAVFANGQRLGGQGSFSPILDPVAAPTPAVMPIPPDLIDGPIVLIAVREWDAPAFTESGAPNRPSAQIEQTAVLRLSDRAENAERLIAYGPQYALSVALALAGFALLLVWRWTRKSEHLWATIFLYTPFWDSLLSLATINSSLSYQALNVLIGIDYSVGLLAEVEFIWSLFQLRSKTLRTIWHLLWIVFMLARSVQAFALEHPHLVQVCHVTVLLSTSAFEAIVVCVCIREFLRKGGNRIFATAFLLFEAMIVSSIFGFSTHREVGLFRLDLVDLTLSLLDLTIGAILLRRAWLSWRRDIALRSEFKAAADLQQRLVPLALPALHGCRVEAAFKPAADVGGDFYQILPGKDGSTLIFLGDVSGKGLRAAMTGVLAIGALRTLAAENLSPATLLDRLNNQLCAAGQGGFTTGLALHVNGDGKLTAANAGHLPPYLDGKEIPLDNGLPLGLVPGATYCETTLRLAHGAQLTLLTDGVVEARNPSGELFGFERTAAISTQTAEAIAHAAQVFGQEDDITVLTLSFAPVEVVHA
jgi:hypothetical protein